MSYLKIINFGNKKGIMIMLFLLLYLNYYKIFIVLFILNLRYKLFKKCKEMVKFILKVYIVGYVNIKYVV